MEKFSVKKPFTVLVAVLMVLVLGAVSITRIATDLLPTISMPMLLVITTYPGASPEKVEESVTKPMESGLGTVSGVKNVYSTSSENFSMVQLEFEDDTDMDSALVKVSSAMQQVAVSLPELCGTPSIMEISMDMMPTLYLSVSNDNYDVYALSNYIENTVQPAIERVEGVANVTTTGMVEKTIQVELNQEKIDKVNADLLAQVDEGLAEAKESLDDALAEVEKGQQELKDAQGTFGSMVSSQIFGAISDPLNGQISALQEQIAALNKQLEDLENGQAVDPDIPLPEIPGLTQQESVAFLTWVIAPPATAAELTAEQVTMLAKVMVANAPAETPITQEAAELAIRDEATYAMFVKAMQAQFATQLPLPDVGTPDAKPDTDTESQIASMRAALEKLNAQLAAMPAMVNGLQAMYGAMTQAQLEAAIGFSTATIQLATAESQLKSAQNEYETAKESALENANLDELLAVNTLSQIIYAQNFAMPAGYIDDAQDNAWLLKIGEEYETAESLSHATLLSMDGIGEVTLDDVADVTVIDNADESYARLNGNTAVILSVYKSSTIGTNEVSDNCAKAFEDLQAKTEGTHITLLMDQGDYITMIINSVVSSMIFGAAFAIVILAIFLKDIMPTLVVGVSIPLSVLFAIVLMYFTDISINMMSLCGLALGIGMLVDNSVVVIENIYRLRGRGVNAARAAVQGTIQVTGAITASTLTTVCVFLPLVFTTGMVRELLMPMGLCIAYCLFASLFVAVTVVPATASTLLRNSKPKEHPWFEKLQEFYGQTLEYCLRVKIVPLAIAVVLLVGCIWQVFQTGLVMIPSMTSDELQVTVKMPADIERADAYARADEVIEALLSVENITEVGAMAGSTTDLMASMMGGSSSSNYKNYTFYITLAENAGVAQVEQATADMIAATEHMDCTVTVSSSGMTDMSSLTSSGLSITVSGNDLETLQETGQVVAGIIGEVDGFVDIYDGVGEGEQTIQLVIDKDKAMEYGLTVAQIYAEIASRLTTEVTSTAITVGTETMTVQVGDHTSPLTLENLMDIEFEAVDMTGATSGGMSMDMSAMGQDDTEEEEDEEEETSKTHKLSEFATKQITTSVSSIGRENQTRYITVTAGAKEGENVTLLSRELQQKLDEAQANGMFPEGYSVVIGGESDDVMEMVEQMMLMILIALTFIYLVMVAQFQSLLSPFIVLFTIPLAFTGGFIGIMISGQELSLLSLMGFLVLMGTVVNNGIVFVDYTNQLRMGGMERQAALIATGKTRMRPIFMTALTTILAMVQMIFGDDMGSQLGGGMAIVIVGGLVYATLMTLYVVPVMYDLLFKRAPLSVDVGNDNIDDVPDDAAEFIAQALAQKAKSAKQTQEEEPSSCEKMNTDGDDKDEDTL